MGAERGLRGASAGERLPLLESCSRLNQPSMVHSPSLVKQLRACHTMRRSVALEVPRTGTHPSKDLIILGRSLAVHIAAVSDAQHEDDEFVILDFVDDAILADADAALTFAARELDITLRARVRGEAFDGLLDSLPLIRMDLAEGFRSGGLVGDRVSRHGRAVRNGSEAQLGHEFLVGDAPLLVASLGCVTNVRLILQSLEGTVKKFRGDNDGATSAATAENLNRPALCGVEHLALMCAKIAKSRRGHAATVHLVQVRVKSDPIALPLSEDGVCHFNHFDRT